MSDDDGERAMAAMADDDKCGVRDDAPRATAVAASIHLPINTRGATSAVPWPDTSRAGVRHVVVDDTSHAGVRHVLARSFGVSHSPVSSSLSSSSSLFEAACRRTSVPIYDYSDNDDVDRSPPVPCCLNGLVVTVFAAFAEEVPLALSPDAIWCAIAHAVAIHVNVNAEALRDVFVAHAGRKTIEINADSLVPGDASSPWGDVWPQFAAALRNSVKEPEFVAHMTPTFTTTGDVERVAHTVALMDTLKEYFAYVVRTKCGIPRIDLLGDADDWRRVRRHAEAVLHTVDMARWWAADLLPVLDHFVALADGSVDVRRATVFWERIFCHRAAAGSGSTDTCTGWLLVFFPYVKDDGADGAYRRRRFCLFGGGDGDESGTQSGASDGTCGGNPMEQLMDRAFWHRLSANRRWEEGHVGYHALPPGVSKVPFVWKVDGSPPQHMWLCGGLLAAVGAGPNGTVTPAFAWAVLHDYQADDEAASIEAHQLQVRNCRHALERSTYAGGGYVAGWYCDECGASHAPDTERWHCGPCKRDVCVACFVAADTPVASATAPSHATRMATLRAAIAAGADVNAVDENGYSVLMLAAANDDLAMAELLLANGADPNLACKAQGFTALLLAIRRGSVAMLQLLLQYGADANQCTKRGVTPLFMAVFDNRPAMIPLLVERGADVNHRMPSATSGSAGGDGDDDDDDDNL